MSVLQRKILSAAAGRAGRAAASSVSGRGRPAVFRAAVGTLLTCPDSDVPAIRPVAGARSPGGSATSPRRAYGSIRRKRL
jgi:hypothetical protein